MRAQAKRSSAANRDGSVFGQIGIVSTCVLALLVLSGISASSAGAVRVTKLGEIPNAGNAADAGDLFNARTLAANRDGEGSVDPGDFYIVDSNDRVSQFSVTGTFVRAFGIDVVGHNELQTVSIANASSGTYRLTFDGETTAAINFNANSAAVRSALLALPSLNPANVAVSGATGNNTLRTRTVEFVGDLTGTDVLQMSADASALNVGASVDVTTDREGAGGSFAGYEICEAADPCKRGVASAQAGSLNNARGIAVDQDTGNVFVASTTNGRVDVFSATGEFQGAFGWKVDATTPLDELQFCTTATGCQAGESTSKGGGFAIPSPAGQPRGLDVGDDGDIYVPDAVNARYNVYSPTLNGSDEVTDVDFVRSVGYDVIATGPGQAGTPEQQTVTIRATSGTFTLSFGAGAGNTTGPIDFDADPSEVQAALNALATIDGVEGSVTVTGGPGDETGSQPYVVTFGDGLGGFDVPNTISVDSSNLGVPVGTELSCAVTGSNIDSAKTELQWLSNGAPATGPGADTDTYTTVAADVGRPVQCQAFAFNSNDFGSTQVSDSRIVVSDVPAPPPPLAPSGNISSPSPTNPNVGSTITCNPNEANWTGVTEPFAYQWYKDGAPIPAATGETYELIAGDVPGVFQCAVTGSNASGSVTKASQNRITQGGIGSPAAPGGNTGSPNAFATSPLVSTGEETVKGVAALEVCDASVNTCKTGIAGNGAGQFGASNPTGVAVGPDGDVFTLSSGACTEANPCRIQRFDSAGALETPDFGPAEGECSWTRTSGFTTGPGGNGPTALDVDSDNGNVLTLQRIPDSGGLVCELDGESGEELFVSPNSPLVVGTGVEAGLSLGAGASVFAIGQGGGSAVHILGPVAPAPSAITGITDLTATSATIEGEVTVPPEVGSTGFDVAYRFEYSTDGGATWIPEPTRQIGTTTPGDYPVEETLTGLFPNFDHLVRLVTTTSFETPSASEPFTTLEAPPSVDSVILNDADQTSITLRAAITPNSLPTEYHFEWGTDESYGNRIPAEGELNAGAGELPVTVEAPIAGLTPGASYHFRVVATNDADTTEGQDRPFQTLGANDLPDNRAHELVSPADGGAGQIQIGVLNPQIDFGAPALDGNRVLYPVQNGMPGAHAGGWTRWQATRTDAGWSNVEVSPPSVIEPIRQSLEERPSYVLYASKGLNCALAQTHNPVTADTPQVSVDSGVESLYRFNAADGSYDLVTDRVPHNPTIPPTTTFYEQAETSDDCKRVYFTSRYQWISPSDSRLYVWDEESDTLSDAGKLPNGSPGAGALIGGSDTEFNPERSRWNAVSADGEKLFFSAISNEGPDSGKRAVFMREDDGSTVEVTDISLPGPGASAVPNGARYEAATDDGRTVFFVANQGLTDDSVTSGPTNAACEDVPSGSNAAVEAKACDLYAYDTESGELSNLSANSDPANPQGAAVQGAVAIDADGSHVYFAAAGQLTHKQGRTFAQNLAAPNNADDTANIYLWKEGEPLRYVATINRDALYGKASSFFAPPAVLMRYAARWSTQISDDGSRLAFETFDSLAGYDTGGGNAAYLYDAESEKVTCISCVPGGATLQKVSTHTFVHRTTQKLDVERARTMSADGSRVIFRSVDVLAPGAEPGKPEPSRTEEATGFSPHVIFNVYQWHEGQITHLATAEGSSAGRAAFVGISADAGTAFFSTVHQLAPQDTDFVGDLYAVRVDGGIPLPPADDVCDPLAGGSCEGQGSSAPGAAAVATPSFEGAGNPKVRWPKAKQRCGRGKRKVTRNGRARCVKKQARKKGKKCGKGKRKVTRNGRARCVKKQGTRKNKRAANKTRRASR